MEQEQYWNRWWRLRTNRRRVLGGAAAGSLGVAAFGLVGCGDDDDDDDDSGGDSNGETPEPTATTAAGGVERGGTLTIRRSSNMAFWDPQRASGGFDPPISDLYAQRVLDITPEGDIAANLAAEWEQTDETTVTLKLREDISFGDGTPVDSAAVKYTIERGQSDELGAPVRPALSLIESVDTPDQQTVVLHLTGPNAAFLETLTGRAGVLISPTAHQELGDDRFNESPVGAGPYLVEQIIQDGESRFLRNPDWPFLGPDGGQLPYLDEVRVTVIPEDAVSIAALQSGDIDLDYVVSPDNFSTVDANPDIQTNVLDGARFQVAEFATNKDPISDINLRKAVNYAIDREEFAIALAAGLGESATGPLTPLSWADDPNVPSYEYDPDKAREHLALAGYPDGIELNCATYRPPQAELLQAQLEKVGITLVVDQLELAVYQEEFRGKGNYRLATASGPTPLGDPYEFFLTRYGSKGKYNPGEPDYPEFDKLIAESVATFEREERKAIYSELQQMDYDWAYRAWKITEPRIMGFRAGWKGWSWQGYNPDLRLVWKSS